MITLLSFAITIGILVVIHEFGHYAVARWCGVKVQRFSVGFGNVIAHRFDRNGTEWALSTIPLGGYVKMVDEREGNVATEDLPYAFNRKPVWQRMAIVVAGPMANLLLAVLLYWLLFVGGITVLKPTLAEPPAGSPAAVAGFQAGETVTAVDGEKVEDWQGLYWRVLKFGLDSPVLKIETQDAEHQTHIRQLDVSGVDLTDAEHNPLRSLGLTSQLPPLQPVIGEVVPDSPAEQAGLKAGDRILKLDGRPAATWGDLVETVRANPSKRIKLEVARASQEISLEVTPAAVDSNGRTIGRIGAAPRIDEAELASVLQEVRFGPLEALQRAAGKTWDLATFSLEMMGKLVIGQASLKNLSGPVTIADYAGRSAEAGLSAFIGFLALVSVSLGVLNLLPIPLLDGGHLLYYSAEFLTGRPVPDSVQEIGQKIGAALLGALMMLALFNDFHRLLTG